MSGITAEQVRKQVQRFWDAYRAKSAKAMEEMYFSGAIVFSASAHRSERAQLALTRRLREFREGNVWIKACIRSVDVQISGNTAIAAYDYGFCRSKLNRDSSRENLDVPFALGTQVFQPGPDGELRIVHEHLSAADESKKVVLPRNSAETGFENYDENEAVPVSSSERGSTADWTPVRDAMISAEEVRGEVRRFWQLFAGKSKDELERMYSPSAMVFNATVRRGELARLANARRAREFFGPQSSVSPQVGAADVQIVERDLAIASYGFSWHLVRSLAGGKRVDLDVPFCRSTQIFQKDETGVLRILHEHKSAAGPSVSKELPA